MLSLHEIFLKALTANLGLLEQASTPQEEMKVFIRQALNYTGVPFTEDEIENCLHDTLLMHDMPLNEFAEGAIDLVIILFLIRHIKSPTGG